MEALRVVVKRSERRVEVSDGGTAVTLAGMPPSGSCRPRSSRRAPMASPSALPACWRDVARRIELEYCVNVSRSGKVFLPVSGRFSVAEIEDRIARASRALYHDLLDLTSD